MRSENPIISMKNVSKNFGGVRALDGINVDIYQGELLCIVGDNGAGKSTCVNILAGAVQPNPGSRIIFEGNEVQINKPKKAMDLGIYSVYQDLSLCNNLNAYQNIFLGREATSMGRLDYSTMERKTQELFERIGSNVPNPTAPVGVRSGGQRQAIAIARSVLVTPRVILLDEPTAALGVIQRKQVSDLSKQLRDEGLAVVLVSQDLDEVVDSADRVLVMRFGSIVKEFDGGTFTRDDLVSTITGLE